MKPMIFIVMLCLLLGCANEGVELNADNPPQYPENGDYNELTPFEASIIIDKGTEPPFTGEYYEFFEHGVYLCKRCNNPLFRSEDKFHSGSGWPSYDDSIFNSVDEIPDGSRTEIVCSNCGGHLGHIFRGEGYTERDARYCVNSASLNFIPSVQDEETPYPNYQRAIFALGCFWGAEYSLKQPDGVIATSVGYTGGTTDFPTYESVSSHTTGHAEAVEVIFDQNILTYEDLVRHFFDSHDPTNTIRQGENNDGQYRSAIFYVNTDQKDIAELVKSDFQGSGSDVLTQIDQAGDFWQAEDYHQDYIRR